MIGIGPPDGHPGSYVVHLNKPTYTLLKSSRTTREYLYSHTIEPGLARGTRCPVRYPPGFGIGLPGGEGFGILALPERVDPVQDKGHCQDMLTIEICHGIHTSGDAPARRVRQVRTNPFTVRLASMRASSSSAADGRLPPPAIDVAPLFLSRLRPESKRGRAVTDRRT
jgi:hypothetical protein